MRSFSTTSVRHNKAFTLIELLVDPSDGLNVLAIRHDKMTEDNTRPNWGKGNATFVDGHSEFMLRVDAMKPQFYDPLQ